jgi:arylsulfatase A-like enzyme
MKKVIRIMIIFWCISLGISHGSDAQTKPNVILINMDNFGWGELGCYGGGVLRGAPTPRIDKLASEGLRLLNFNVEAQCTPSRAALMTGRYAVRTGNGSVPLGDQEYGLTQWEYTIAEMFGDAGYATAMFGKWHLGDSKGRYPTSQGFDEWYGIPNSTDEAFWADNPMFMDGVHQKVHLEYVMESKKNEDPKNVKVYDLKVRAIMDRELTDRALNYIDRQSKAKKPFFLYMPYTQTHLPVEASPAFAGKSGNGKWGDILAQLDSYVGELLDKIDQMGIRDNTIFIFTSDNGPEFTVPYQGFAGPWRGSYFTGYEGSLRVPFIMRWPGKVPAGLVSNEIVHETDIFPTLANIVGGNIPTDRVIDGINQTDFVEGKKEKSNRESVIIYVGNEIWGVKWRNWKMMTKEIDRGGGEPTRTYEVPLFYNLLLDPGEKYPLQEAEKNLWVRYPMSAALVKHLQSLQQEPPIKPGTPDPYVPKAK